MIDAVLSLHLNPLTCGVAKWNHLLAAKLGVPALPLFTSYLCSQFYGRGYQHPLVSIKFAELNSNLAWEGLRTFDVFLHDAPRDANERAFVAKTQRVYVGNEAIAEAVHCLHTDVVTAFCPSTVTGNPTRGAYRVLVFGMAHKLLLPHFVNLKEHLDLACGGQYTVELSTAVHEGNPWDEALTESVNAMRQIFGDRLRVLGFLGDDALAKELQDVDAVAAFYTPALRANNTSAWAALEAGKHLFTNTDELSPPLVAPSWDSLVSLIHG